ncbi:SecDF P1 head subdomain-containing protein [Geosporobacter ferrireducens]|uniref:SecDF P1 head subdomain domain-containing protein n=1 Tax=Geosporobacter ferrireducens TaxID=1424294 RepID=A0A1D8GMV3_9FIRM|nr:hypothetical protein [Geosporobacter ferrireducens]AOT72225.1 hypothetical protein Gferi_23380 [Geosporobacter ferrireducens]MTI56118.1 hypothetical protein [Geosporobacter ferrireducens]
MFKRLFILLLSLTSALLLLGGCILKPEYGEIVYAVKSEEFTDTTLKDAAEDLVKRAEIAGYSETKVSFSENHIKLKIYDIEYEELESLAQLIAKPGKLNFVEFQGDVILTGKNIKEAQVVFENNANQKPAIAIEFDEEGKNVFSEATNRLSKEKEVENRTLFIFIDEEIISAPVISEPIEGGKAVITGDFTIKEASEIVALLQGGALDIELDVVEINMVK